MINISTLFHIQQIFAYSNVLHVVIDAILHFFLWTVKKNGATTFFRFQCAFFSEVCFIIRSCLLLIIEHLAGIDLVKPHAQYAHETVFLFIFYHLLAFNATYLTSLLLVLLLLFMALNCSFLANVCTQYKLFCI